MQATNCPDEACAGTGRELAFTAPASGKSQRLDLFLVEALKAWQEAGGNAAPAGALDEDDTDPEEADLDSPGAEDAQADIAFETPASFSRETVKRYIAKGLCLLNGTVCTQPGTKVRGNDHVLVRLPAAERGLEAEEGEIELVHQDADVLVLAKQAGLTVHPCPSCPKGTLLQRVVGHFPEIAAMGGQRAGIVHRLDKETSGLMLVARNEAARLALSEAFAARTVHKSYLALVSGRLAARGSCREAIGRDPAHKTRMACVPVAKGGREASTDFECLWTAADGSFSLARLVIHTGRTHQIRVHMSHLGHPLLGDATYGGKAMACLAPRVMLHACAIDFPHPGTGQRLSFRLAPPEDFVSTMLARLVACQPVVVTGNPGSGKSLVTKLLSEKSRCPSLSADACVGAMYARGGILSQWLAERFGADMLREDGCVDRVRLMALFAEKPHLRKEVEDLAHRLVRGQITDFIEQCSGKGLPFALIEIPLFFECGWDRGVFHPEPLVLGVRAGLNIREQRLAASRSWSPDKIAAIESWQWDEERKMAACTRVVDNTASADDLATLLEDDIVPWLEEERRGREKTHREYFVRLLDRAAATALQEQ